MVKATIVYWRDIPAEIIVREGRKRTRGQLNIRFAEAIDMAAMRSGAKDSDAYLDGWRHGKPQPVSGDAAEYASRTAIDVEHAYTAERLALLINNGGTEYGT